MVKNNKIIQEILTVQVSVDLAFACQLPTLKTSICSGSNKPEGSNQNTMRTKNTMVPFI